MKQTLLMALALLFGAAVATTPICAQPAAPAKPLDPAIEKMLARAVDLYGSADSLVAKYQKKAYVYQGTEGYSGYGTVETAPATTGTLIYRRSGQFSLFARDGIYAGRFVADGRQLWAAPAEQQPTVSPFARNSKQSALASIGGIAPDQFLAALLANKSPLANRKNNRYPVFSEHPDKVVRLPTQKIEGVWCDGVMFGEYPDEFYDIQMWFERSSGLMRRVSVRRYGGHVVEETRYLSIQRNARIAPKAFVLPASARAATPVEVATPFKFNALKPFAAAERLLARAARVYGGANSLSLNFETVTRTSKEKGGPAYKTTGEFFFERPDKSALRSQSFLGRLNGHFISNGKRQWNTTPEDETFKNSTPVDRTDLGQWLNGQIPVNTDLTGVITADFMNAKVLPAQTINGVLCDEVDIYAVSGGEGYSVKMWFARVDGTLRRSVRNQYVEIETNYTKIQLNKPVDQSEFIIPPA